MINSDCVTRLEESDCVTRLEESDCVTSGGRSGGSWTVTPLQRGLKFRVFVDIFISSYTRRNLLLVVSLLFLNVYLSSEGVACGDSEQSDSSSSREGIKATPNTETRW